jgi:hypothetical protein
VWEHYKVTRCSATKYVDVAHRRAEVEARQIGRHVKALPKCKAHTCE